MSQVSLQKPYFVKIGTEVRDNAAVMRDLESRFANQNISATFDKRGTTGSPVELRTNALEISFSNKTSLYEYSISIVPALDDAESDIAPLLLKAVLSTFGGNSKVVHDGGQKIISVSPLATNESVKLSVGDQNYEITLSSNEKLDAKDLASFIGRSAAGYNANIYISALNVLVHSKAVETAYRTGGGIYAFPHAPAGAQAVAADVEAWTGFLATVRPIFKGLALNVNALMRAFYLPRVKLSDLMVNVKQSQRGQDPDWNALFGRLKLSVNVGGVERKRAVKSIGPGTARSTSITTEGGRATVESFYAPNGLTHPDDLPIINVGSKSKDVFVPAELCTILPSSIGSAPPGVLTRDGERTLSKISKSAPGAVTQVVKNQLQAAFGLKDMESLLRAFGIEKIANDLLPVSSRILSPPSISGSHSDRDAPFAKVAQSAFKRIAVLVIRDGHADDFGSMSDPDLEIAVKSLQTALKAKGVELDERALLPTVVVNIAINDTPARKEAARIIKSDGIGYLSEHQQPTFLFVVLSKEDPRIYSIVKNVCDIELGIPSHCIDNTTARTALVPKEGEDLKMSRLRAMSKFTILQKANAKVGGSNHQVDFSPYKMLNGSMLVGMSISAKEDQPALAAVVASSDGTFSNYPASIRLQDKGRKVIADLGAMLLERLEAYKNGGAGVYPKTVIVFRTGSSDGLTQMVHTYAGPKTEKQEFVNKLKGKYGAVEELTDKAQELENGNVQVTFKVKTVFGYELDAIQKALASLGKNRPSLTVITASRSHNTRFYTNSSEAAENPKAGTVVDEKITGVYSFEFYLQAHDAQKDTTVRPTKYTVVVDENKFTADDVQQAIYAVSYNSGTTSRSVSLVPPARLATKASHHARAYLNDWVHASPEAKRREKAVLDSKANKGFIHKDLQGVMFYV